MLKTLSIKLAEPKKVGVGVADDSRAKFDGGKHDEKKIGDNEVDDEFDNKVEKKGQKMSKSKNLYKIV